MSTQIRDLYTISRTCTVQPKTDSKTIVHQDNRFYSSILGIEIHNECILNDKMPLVPFATNSGTEIVAFDTKPTFKQTTKITPSSAT